MKYDMRDFKTWGSQKPLVSGCRIINDQFNQETSGAHDSPVNTALTFHRCPSLHKVPHGPERRGVRSPRARRYIGRRSPRSLEPEQGPTQRRPMETWKPSSPDSPHRCPRRNHHLVPSFCESARPLICLVENKVISIPNQDFWNETILCPNGVSTLRGSDGRS